MGDTFVVDPNEVIQKLQPAPYDLSPIPDASLIFSEKVAALTSHTLIFAISSNKIVRYAYLLNWLETLLHDDLQSTAKIATSLLITPTVSLSTLPQFQFTFIQFYLIYIVNKN